MPLEGTTTGVMIGGLGHRDRMIVQIVIDQAVVELISIWALTRK